MKRLLGFFCIALLVCTFGLPTPASAECGIKKEVKKYEGPRSSSGLGATTCYDEEEVCGENTIRYSCCFCEVTSNSIGDAGNVLVEQEAERGHTNASCKQACETSSFASLNQEARIYSQVGAGALPPAAPGQETKTAVEVNETLKFCFAPADCASEEYGGSSEAFRPGHGCSAGEGRCVAPEPKIDLSYPIGNVKTVAGLRGFIGVIFNYAVSIAAVAAAVMFVYGGMRYIFGSAFQNIKRAKEIMIDAAIGLALVLGAMLILRTVNPETLKLNKLEIFMINKEQVLDQNFCLDIPSKKPLTFADAGQSPAFIPVGQLSSKDYTIKGEGTQCGYEYYIDGFGDGRCKGKVCQKQGEACLPCDAGFCDGPKGSFGCVESTISGRLVQDGVRKVLAVQLLLVCNNIYNNFSYGSALVSQLGAADSFLELNTNFPAGAVVQVKKADLGSESNLAQTYSIKVQSKNTIENVKADCGEGGPLGYALAIKYEDNSLVNLKDNYAAVSKLSCGGAAVFSGYEPSYIIGDDVDSGLQNVMACFAARLDPKHTKGAVSFISEMRQYLWTEDEIQKAVSGDKPIICDLSLNASNAPADLKKLPNTAPGTYGKDSPQGGLLSGPFPTLPLITTKSSLGFIPCYGN
ncbi:MAG: pilin [Patescibacteria group bacterium]|jgi:hypothetical protein